MRVISLGWGVQSFTLAAMAALGDIEPIDAAIHADTTHERSATYEFAAKWTPWLEERGVRVVTVTPPDAVPVDRYGGVMLPAYSATAKGGKFDRQCTDNWKRKTIRRWLQANRKRQPVTMLLGISRDEFWRAKDSDVKYIKNVWPLLFDKNMTRGDCVEYLTAHGLDVPTKSACVFCPFQRKSEWREIKDNAADWQKAIAADLLIRKTRPPYDLFVHSSRIPLVDVDLSTPEDHGQLRLINEECDSGYCFL